MDEEWFYHAASSYNHQGIASLRSNNVEIATTCFQQALRSMLEADNASICGAAAAVRPILSQQRPHFRAPLQEHVENPDIGFESVYLCREAFHLDESVMSMQAGTWPTEVVVAMLLFNLGLAFQLQGDTGDTYEHRGQLVSAVAVYTQARSMLESIGVHSHFGVGIEQVELLRMALLNNMGYATFRLGDYVFSESIYRQLIVFGQTVHYSEHSQSQWYRGQFVLNAAFLRPALIAPAA